MNRSRALLMIALVTALSTGVVGCTDTAEKPETTPSPSVTTTPPESSESPTDEESIVMPPAPPAGTPAAVAWEALMSPDGEYDASASYQAVIDKFGQVEPYVTIQAAEDRHTEALIRQLTRFGVEIPENPYLGKVSAPEDLEAAARAWAESEVENIEMYDQLLTETSDSALIRVLTNLRNASANSHLPAFQAAAENGGTLTPEQMSEFHIGRQTS